MSEDMDESEDRFIEFNEMGLDSCLLQAIDQMGWRSPTLIQEKAIPLALEGNDILAKARTGTGKSTAFALPIINGLLAIKDALNNDEDLMTRQTRALILSPTKELSNQLTQHFKELTAFCSREITVLDISTGRVDDLKAIMTSETPDIIFLNWKNQSFQKVIV